MKPDYDTRDRDGMWPDPELDTDHPADKGTPQPKQVTDAAQALKLMFAGNFYFTLRSKVTGLRFTYRVGMPKKARAEAKPWFYVSLLNGPDNTSNYTWLGTILPNGVFKQADKPFTPSMDAPSMRAFLWTWGYLQSAVKAGRTHMPENLEFWHEGRCCRCGRLLTVPRSIALGIGPECEGRI